MLSFSATGLENIQVQQLKTHEAKLSAWLESQDVGWDAYSDEDRRHFLDANAERAREHDMLSENSRAMMAYAFLLSGDAAAFAKRSDVIAALSSERSSPAAKKRRLHAIASDVKYGTTFATEKAPTDKTFEMRTAEGAS